MALASLYRQPILDRITFGVGEVRMALDTSSTSAEFGFDRTTDAIPLARWMTFCRRVSYKPGWTVTVEAAGARLVRLDVAATVDDVRAYTPGSRWWQARQRGEQVPPVQVGAASLAPLDLDERGMLEAVRDALLLVERHELDEWLMVDGHPPFDPHGR